MLADLFRLRFGTGVERLVAMLLTPSLVLWAAVQVRAFGQVIANASTVHVDLAILLAAAFTVGGPGEAASLIVTSGRINLPQRRSARGTKRWRCGRYPSADHPRAPR